MGEEHLDDELVPSAFPVAPFSACSSAKKAVFAATAVPRSLATPPYPLMANDTRLRRLSVPFSLPLRDHIMRGLLIDNSNNPTTPLDCWREVDAFKAEVNKLEAVSWATVH